MATIADALAFLGAKLGAPPLGWPFQRRAGYQSILSGRASNQAR